MQALAVYFDDKHGAIAVSTAAHNKLIALGKVSSTET